MAWEFTPYVLPLLCSGLVSLVVAWLVWRRQPAAGAGPLALTALAAAWWSLGNAVELASVHLEGKLVWANLEYLGITVVPVFWFTLATRYSSLGRKPTRSQLVLLLLVPLVTNLLVWTNDHHGLMRQNVWLDIDGPYARVAKTYGPWLWVHAVYSYSLLMAGSVLLFRQALRSPFVYRGQAASLLVAVLLPWLANAVYLFGQGTIMRLDPTPVAFTISSAAAAWGLFRYGLLDVVPAARDAVFASMTDCVIVVDAQGRIVDLNPAAQRLAACTEQQAIGRPLASLLSGEDELVSYLDGSPEAGAEVALGPAGDRTAYDLSVSPLHDGQNRLVGRVITLRDITQRKQLEEQVRRSQKMEAVSLLAGGIAHHFNNLLTVVNGYSEFVLRGLEPSSPLREDVEAILRAGTQAADLTRRLLVFSRFRKPHLSVMDLNEVLRGMEASLRDQLGTNVTMDIQLDPDAGNIEADPALIEQIVANLTANARDAMPGGGRLTISSGHVLARDVARLKGMPAASERYVTLRISDNGIGMTPEVQAHLFEPFYTTKGVGEGTGLGLATVYGIVGELHGGIEIETELGVGTTVCIYLPRVEAEPAAAPAVASGAAPSTDDAVILVVEDEDDVRRFVVQSLQREGYTVLEARDGAEALATAAAHEAPIALVLTDVVMPHMDGAELVRRLRALYPDVQALYMSGFPDSGEAIGADAEAIRFVAKPFTGHKLRDAVQRALASRTMAA